MLPRPGMVRYDSRVTSVRKAVFPAAGLGTRFLPATKAQPKEMLPLVDKPIIQYGVEEAIGSGVNNIILVTGRGKNAIEDHFDVAVELETFLEARGKKKLLAQICKISNLNRVASFSQGHHVSMRKTVLTPDIFPLLEETAREKDRTGEIQLTNGLRKLLKTRPIYGYRVDGVRHDTGNKLGFLKAVVYFALQRDDLSGPFREYLRGLGLEVPAGTRR